MSAQEVQEITQVFELLPGNHLDLQINHPNKVRLKLPLIGYEEGSYIILKYPRVSRDTDYKDVLVEGNVMVVRYIIEGEKGECFAFRSTIKAVTKYPEKFIILDYPKKIENRQLRQHQRASTHLIASLAIDNTDSTETSVINGVIGDISEKGCGFTFRAENDKIKVNKREVFVCLMHPNGNEIKVLSKVCNSRNNKGVVSVGIQFIDKENQIPDLLNSLMIGVM